MSTAQQLEDSIIDNSTSRKVNAAESNYLDPYTPVDSLYAEATELLVFMGERNVDVDVDVDVDVLQDFLRCKLALQKGDSKLKERTRRAPREPPCRDL